MERSFGFFHRTLPVPCETDKEKVEGRYKDDVLEVMLPKSKKSLYDLKKVQIKPAK